MYYSKDELRSALSRDYIDKDVEESVFDGYGIASCKERYRIEHSTIRYYLTSTDREDIRKEIDSMNRQVEEPKPYKEEPHWRD
ncbi:MAG: hypothetical protein Q7S74_05960 [Nanoarchaeota archaeon]|nr:hypothetical protein [Nanoarchaeota archaeon]